jgi:hypothetical protein
MKIGQATLEHLQTNVVYPATGEQIIRASDYMAQIPATERQIDIERIKSRKTYASASEVLSDLQSCDDPGAALYAGHPGRYVRFCPFPTIIY